MPVAVVAAAVEGAGFLVELGGCSSAALRDEERDLRLVGLRYPPPWAKVSWALGGDWD